MIRVSARCCSRAPGGWAGVKTRREPADCPRVSEVPPPSSYLRESRLARAWALLVVSSLSALVPFVYANLYAQTFPGTRGDSTSYTPGRGVWLAFAVVQVANKVPVAYRYSARSALAALDLVGFTAGLAAVVALGTGLALPGGLARSGWFALVSAWLVACVWYQLDPRSPQNRGVAPGRRFYCAIVASLIPGLPFALAVLALPTA